MHFCVVPVCMSCMGRALYEASARVLRMSQAGSAAVLAVKKGFRADSRSVLIPWMDQPCPGQLRYCMLCLCTWPGKPPTHPPLHPPPSLYLHHPPPPPASPLIPPLPSLYNPSSPRKPKREAGHGTQPLLQRLRRVCCIGSVHGALLLPGGLAREWPSTIRKPKGLGFRV